MALLLSASRCGQGVGGGQAGRGGVKVPGTGGEGCRTSSPSSDRVWWSIRMPDWGEQLLGVLLPIGSAYITCNTHSMFAHSCGRIARQGMWEAFSQHALQCVCLLPSQQQLVTTCPLQSQICCSRQIVTSVARAKSKGTKPASRQLSYSGAVAYEADLEAVA